MKHMRYMPGDLVSFEYMSTYSWYDSGLGKTVTYEEWIQVEAIASKSFGQGSIFCTLTKGIKWAVGYNDFWKVHQHSEYFPGKFLSFKTRGLKHFKVLTKG